MNNPLLLIILLLALTVSIAVLVIPFFYIKYIYKLKEEGNCECSEGLNRKFIYYYSIFVYVALVVMIICSFITSKKIMKDLLRSPGYLIVSTILSFTFGYFMYQYYRQVSKECACAMKTVEPKIMKYHAILIFITTVLSILNIINILINGNMGSKKRISRGKGKK
jgi:hypothetical protein